MIIEVEGKAVKDLGMNPAIGLIRGPVNTPVEFRIRRAGGDEVAITAMRRKIRA